MGYFDDPALDYVEDTRTLTRLDWISPTTGTDIMSSMASTNGVWIDIPGIQQTFEVGSSTSVVEVHVAGNAFNSTSATANGSRVVIDGDQSTSQSIGGGFTNVNVISGGMALFRNLAPGVHTVKVQVKSANGAGSWLLRNVSFPLAEFLRITVVERKQGGKLGVAGKPVYFRPEKQASFGTDATPLALTVVYGGHAFTPTVPGVQIVGGVLRATINGVVYTVTIKRLSDFVDLGTVQVTGTGGAVAFRFPQPVSVPSGVQHELGLSTPTTNQQYYGDAGSNTNAATEDLSFGGYSTSTVSTGATSRTAQAANLHINTRLDYSLAEAGVLAPSSGTRTKPRKAMPDWVNPTSISVSTAANTWKDFGPLHTFNLLSGSSMTEIIIRGYLRGDGTDMVSRIVVDGDTANALMLGAHYHIASGTFGWPLTGAQPVYLENLPSGSHTVQLQVITSAAGTVQVGAALAIHRLYAQILEHGW